MPGNGRHCDDPQTVLDHIADEITERFRCGEQPRVEEYIRKHPQLVDELAKIFTVIATLHASRLEDADESTHDDGA